MHNRESFLPDAGRYRERVKAEFPGDSSSCYSMKCTESNDFEQTAGMFLERWTIVVNGGLSS